jgi:hypothetical protein
MRALPLVFLLLTACGKSGPKIDQKTPFFFQLEGKQAVVESVEWGKTEERSGIIGRKTRDGRKVPMVSSGTFATKPFTVDGKTVSIELSFEFGKGVEGGIKIDDKLCDFDGEYFQGGRGTIGKVSYKGFQGTCKLDGKQQGFMFGPVVAADDKDPDE